MKYSRNPSVYTDIGGSSVRAIQKSASERLVQPLDPTACSLDPIRQHTFDLFLTNFNYFGASGPLVARPPFHNSYSESEIGRLGGWGWKHYPE